MRTLTLDRSPVDLSSLYAKHRDAAKIEISFSPLRTLDGLERFRKVRELRISYCRQLADLAAVSKLVKLEWLILMNLPRVTVGFDLGKLRRLEHLSFVGYKQLDTLSGIERLRGLKYLGLSKTKVADGDWDPIAQCPSLERVFWFGSPFGGAALKELRAARPDLVIGGNSAHPRRSS